MDDAEMWFFMDRIADPGILSGSFEFECPECGFCCEVSYDADSNNIYSCPECQTLVDVSGF